MEYSKKLTSEELERIDRAQIEMHDWSRGILPEGEEVEFLGEKFIVYPNVFWLLSASPLIKGFTVKPSDSVLDVGTGTGLIAIFAAKKGAGRVLAIDINPAAVRNAQLNAKLHSLEEIIEVRESDLWEKVGEERFDVITANLPFREKTARDMLEISTWDSDFQVHKRFFGGVIQHLKPQGRIYLSQANFGELEKVEDLAKEYDLTMTLIAEEKCINDPRVFYVFELKSKHI